ncbi:hypothetical protein NIES593_08040 [Hydrococcus rivularis NIES-593]|uniref:Uncharacterized protein n=1 Tax=Hydrococcus rivularis NIES-593 TaxID=1921803 RepID=A0A1U7HKQ3_9CYAN|nr:hypothetical protein NIES593_08040 [Hydrococcus rivularis NIES-593]
MKLITIAEDFETTKKVARPLKDRDCWLLAHLYRECQGQLGRLTLSLLVYKLDREKKISQSCFQGL